MTLPAKLTVASTFPIHPARGGGQLRILNLYRHLAERRPVDVIALVEHEEPPSERMILPGLREVRVPKSAAHAAAEAQLEREVGIAVSDVAFPALHELTPQFAGAVTDSAAPGGVIVASHPYTFPALAVSFDYSPLWYDAHNVEVDLKAGVLPKNSAGRRLLAATREVEKACCKRAVLVLAPSREDSDRLRRLYRVPEDRVVVVPNGVNTSQIRFTGAAERRALQARLRLPRPVALFIGSWHEPNVRAVARIIDLSLELPRITFAIVGSVGLAFRKHDLPNNVELFGAVSDAFKDALLAVAALALNPVSEGSGTNMKMLDYMAAGVPVLSTEVGTRGLELERESHVCIRSLKHLASGVLELLSESPQAAERRLRAARHHVEERFDWAAVSRRLVTHVAEPRPVVH